MIYALPKSPVKAELGRRSQTPGGLPSDGSTGSPATLVVRGGIVLPMDETQSVFDPGWVLVSGRTISRVGGGIPPPTLPGTVEIDATGSVVIPGLMNSHTHLEQAFMRGVADDKFLDRWLHDAVGPLQKAMSPDDVYLAVQLGLLENIRFGVTSVLQHHKVTQSYEHVAAAIEAAATTGVRMRLARGWRDSGSSRESIPAIITETLRASEHCRRLSSGRLSVGFGPTWLPHCSDAGLKETCEVAHGAGLFSHCHIAETRDEVAQILKFRGRRPIELLHDLGVLTPEMQLVHGVHATLREIEQVARAGAVVVHCPVSNAHLACGVAPIADFRRAGVTVALGSDGPASNNCQDLLQTAKFAILSAKQREGDPAILSCFEALRMLTAHGARIMRDPSLGTLATGKAADMCIFNLATPNSCPVHSVPSALVMSASGSDARTVIIDGEVMIRDGRALFFDEDTLLQKCAVAASRLYDRAGLPRPANATEAAHATS